MSVINFLCNIIWFLLAGIWLALGWALVGVVWCITIVGIPMTYSITNGIGLGFIFYCFIMVALGRVREVKPLMWIAALAFLVMFIFA